MSRAQRIAIAATLAAAYFGAAKLGLSLATISPSATAVWPPTGIAIAGVLLAGPGVWPGIFVGAFLANVTTAGTVWTSLAIATGNTLEALVACALVTRFAGGARAFDRASHAMRFALLAGFLATAVSATIGVTSLALAGFAPWSGYAPIWLTWWLGDAGGAIVIAPLLLLWARPLPRMAPSEAALGLGLLAGSLACAVLVFNGIFPSIPLNPPLSFVPLPLVVWAAVRFGPRGASASTAIIALVAAIGTMRGTGPFAPLARDDALVLLQTFAIVLAITGLTLGAVVRERASAEAELRRYRDHLEDLVTARTNALTAANAELESFSYTVSHDLRAPLRAIDSYGEMLLEDPKSGLSEEGREMVRRIRTSSQRLALLTDELLRLAQVTRGELRREQVDLSAIAKEVSEDLKASDPKRDVEFRIAKNVIVDGDAALLRVVLRNLIDNAWKFTSHHPHAKIEFGANDEDGHRVFYVRDDGAGVNMAHAPRLFHAFQRLHPTSEFEGTGIGLATVAKIIHRHGGRVWVDGAVEKGATFSFTLG